MSKRSEALAYRLEQGARALASLANSLSPAEWEMRVPHDGRKFGVIVHHVANMYPLEMQIAQTLAEGQPVTGVTWDVIAGINAAHAKEHESVTREAALEALRSASAAAAATIRGYSDQVLDRAATVSLYFDAPLTCQFWLEDHPVRHSYHHLGKIRAALEAIRPIARSA